MSNKENYQLVGQSMVSDQEGFRIIKSWYMGWHPELGKLINGWSGQETEVENEVIKAVKVIYVKERE